VFSAAVEVVLAITYREAVSRRHAYVTLEHLLYALAHDDDGERILAACGTDLPRLRRELDTYLNESIERVKRGDAREPEQTAAFRRVLQTAVLHVQSAQRAEVQAGDIFAAILQQPKAYAAQLLAAQGVTRLDVLEYIAHGISKTPLTATPDGSGATQQGAAAGGGDEGSATARDPLSAYCSNLSARRRWPKAWPRGCSAPAISRYRTRSKGRKCSPSIPRGCLPAHGSAATSKNASRR
jgi:ATP-dependent Clp protease ATP-binding subunit ClpA